MIDYSKNGRVIIDDSSILSHARSPPLSIDQFACNIGEKEKTPYHCRTTSFALQRRRKNNERKQKQNRKEERPTKKETNKVTHKLVSIIRNIEVSERFLDIRIYTIQYNYIRVYCTVYIQCEREWNDYVVYVHIRTPSACTAYYIWYESTPPINSSTLFCCIHVHIRRSNRITSQQQQRQQREWKRQQRPQQQQWIYRAYRSCVCVCLVYIICMCV